MPKQRCRTTGLQRQLNRWSTTRLSRKSISVNLERCGRSSKIKLWLLQRKRTNWVSSCRSTELILDRLGQIPITKLTSAGNEVLLEVMPFVEQVGECIPREVLENLFLICEEVVQSVREVKLGP